MKAIALLLASIILLSSVPTLAQDGLDEAYGEDTLESDHYDESAVNESVISYRILMVISPQDYSEPEFDIPRSYFEDQEFEVLVASSGVNTATGDKGAEAEVDLNVSDVDASEYVAVVFIGGMGVDDLRLYDDEDYLDLARGAGEEDKIVGGICLSSKILANAGLYQGKNATVCGSERFHDPIDYIQERGAVYVAQSVVRDGKTIFGRGPPASQSFAEAIVEAIREEENGTEAIRAPIAEGAAATA
ncbi:MAG: DJ-1/PfpI family protein [Methanotrichaceae archaeon]